MQKTLPSIISTLGNYTDVICNLQNLKINYPSIIRSQKEALSEISYIKENQKAVLLRTERKQKETLLLGQQDIENSKLITASVQSTIAIVNQISHNPESTLLLDTDVFNQNLDLCECLSAINPSYYNMLLGARQTAQSNNPDRARQVAISLRELLRKFINTLIPNNEVKTQDGNKVKASLDMKISYFFSEITDSCLEAFILS
jgi:hypothetical protein